MSHIRRHHSNPTPTDRCGYLVVDKDSGVGKSCHGRVFKEGRCIQHYVEYRNGKTYRGSAVTRRKIGIDPDTGRAIYSPVDNTIWCNRINCRKHAVISADNIAWCEEDFMRDQRKTKRKEA